MDISDSSIKDESLFKREIPDLFLNNDNETIIYKLLELIKKDKTNFIEWVCFIDSFERKSEAFRNGLNIHVKLMKIPEYLNMFTWLKTEFDKHKELSEICPEIYFMYKNEHGGMA